MSEELKDSDIGASTPVYKKAIPFVATFLVAVLVALAAGTWGLGFSDHYEEPSLADKKAELIDMMSNGQFDYDLDLAYLTNTNLSVFGEYVRVVHVTATRNYTKDEVLDILKQTYPEQVKSFDDVPQNIKDGFNSDGFFPASVANGNTYGFLANDRVIVPLSAFGSILQSKAEDAGKIQVEIKVLANPEVEDDWKEEVLFSGTAEAFVKNPDVVLDGPHGLGIFSRPSSQVLIESDELPYAVAKIEEMNTGNAVVYGNTARTAIAKVSVVVEDQGLIALSGVFTGQDIGVPVFVLRDGQPMWAGVIVSVSDAHTAVVASTNVVQAKALKR